MKACPYCAEQVQDAAVVCKHCGKDLSKPPQKKGSWFPKVLLGLGVLIVLVFIGQLMDSTPKTLSNDHYKAIADAHRAKAWIEPKSIELRNGIVVLDYEYPNSIAIPPKTLGETRLLAIREALLPFGFSSFRVNVNGEPPGTGLVRRFGSARFLGSGEIEWLTP